MLPQQLSSKGEAVERVPRLRAQDYGGIQETAVNEVQKHRNRIKAPELQWKNVKSRPWHVSPFGFRAEQPIATARPISTAKGPRGPREQDELT